MVPAATAPPLRAGRALRAVVSVRAWARQRAVPAGTRSEHTFTSTSPLGPWCSWKPAAAGVEGESAAARPGSSPVVASAATVAAVSSTARCRRDETVTPDMRPLHRSVALHPWWGDARHSPQHPFGGPAARSGPVALRHRLPTALPFSQVRLLA